MPSQKPTLTVMGHFKVSPITVGWHKLELPQQEMIGYGNFFSTTLVFLLGE